MLVSLPSIFFFRVLLHCFVPPFPFCNSLLSTPRILFVLPTMSSLSGPRPRRVDPRIWYVFSCDECTRVCICMCLYVCVNRDPGLGVHLSRTSITSNSKSQIVNVPGYVIFPDLHTSVPLYKTFQTFLFYDNIRKRITLECIIY